MKILLINPPFLTNYPISLGFGEPLGLAYVAAAVEASPRHQVEVLDCVGSAGHLDEHRRGELYWIGISHEEAIAQLARRQFDAIGVSMCRTSNVDPGTMDLVRLIRVRYPDIPIIVGGPEATHSWEHYVPNRDISYTVIGEGERALVHLLDAIEDKSDPRAVDGLVFLDETGSVVRTKEQGPVDIDSIVWPARHLFPMESYITNRPTTMNRAVTILTSRACPFNCAFCSTIHVWGRNWRGRSAQDVVDEIEFVVQQYGVTEVRIQDDNFCVNRKRVEAFCALLVERGLNIELVVDPGVMSSLATADLLRKLNSAGLKNINMQLESGSARTQKYICKPIDLDHMRAMVEVCHELGMHVATNLIIGFPFETKEDMVESVTNACSINFDSINFYYLNPMVNTRARRDMVENGLLGADDLPVLPVGTVHCSAAETKAVYDYALELFEKTRRHPPLGRQARIDAAAVTHAEGHCFTVPVPDGHDIADHSDAPYRSPCRLYEDDKALGPAHAMHRQIRNIGEGLFSHWEWRLYFSASDNSDPRTNGRAYRVEF